MTSKVFGHLNRVKPDQVLIRVYKQENVVTEPEKDKEGIGKIVL